jgi:hypothetical protein
MRRVWQRRGGDPSWCVAWGVPAAILQHRLKGVYLKLMCTDYVAAATKSTFSPFGRRRHHVTGSRKKHSLARRYASLSVRIMKICRYFIMKDLFMRLNGL